MQSVPITTNVVSSNPAQARWWLATGRWFFAGNPVSSTNKTDRHDITELLLKVALNIIKQANQVKVSYIYVSSSIQFYIL